MLLIRLNYSNCITYTTIPATDRLTDLAIKFGATSVEIISYQP